MKPVISVIVPTYNRAKYLSRCIRSVLKQSESSRDYEIIVVDDGSTDETEVVLDAFSSVVRMVRNDENQGLPASLNRALEIVEGKFVVRVDSDDYVNRYFLSCLRAFLVLNEGVDAVASDYLIVDDQERILSRESAKQSPIGCGILLRTTDIISLGGYNEEYLVHEDREFMQRYEQQFEVQFLNIPLYRYRRHDENLTNDTAMMEAYALRLEEGGSNLLA